MILCREVTKSTSRFRKITLYNLKYQNGGDWMASKRPINILTQQLSLELSVQENKTVRVGKYQGDRFGWC